MAQRKKGMTADLGHGYMSNKGLTAAERKARALIRCRVFRPEEPAFFTMALYTKF